MQNEIDHRIKNNLNMISSILGLQILNLKNGSNESAEDILLKSKLRIEALAMVHNALDSSEDIIEVNFTKYVNNLSSLLMSTFCKNIAIKIDASDIYFNANTMLKLGLIFNELLTNSLKHALPFKGIKSINIILRKKRSYYTLIYKEEGGKFVNIQKIRKSKTLGIKLISLLLKEMNATMNIFQKDGLAFQIQFKYQSNNT